MLKGWFFFLFFFFFFRGEIFRGVVSFYSFVYKLHINTKKFESALSLFKKKITKGPHFIAPYLPNQYFNEQTGIRRTHKLKGEEEEEEEKRRRNLWERFQI